MAHWETQFGEMFTSLARAIGEAEVPLLGTLGLDLWEYMVLTRLDDGAAPTQLALAASVRRDPTRLIPTLDGLQNRGLISRAPDPNDRRNRIISLTMDGRALLADARNAVAGIETELLQSLNATEQKQLRLLVRRLVVDHESRAAGGAKLPPDLID